MLYHVWLSEEQMQVNSKVTGGIILIPELHTLISFQIFIHIGILMCVHSRGFGSVFIDTADVLFQILLPNCFWDFTQFASSERTSDNLYGKLIVNPRVAGGFFCCT